MAVSGFSAVARELHPQRWLRSRPFANEALAAHASGTTHGGTTKESMEAVLHALQGVEMAEETASEGLPIPASLVGKQELALACHVASWMARGSRTVWCAGWIERQTEPAYLDTATPGGTMGAIGPSGSVYVALPGARPLSLAGPPNRIDGAYLNRGDGVLEVTLASTRANPDPANWQGDRDRYFWAGFRFSTGREPFGRMLDRMVAAGELPLEAPPPPPVGAGAPKEAVIGGRRVMAVDVTHLSRAAIAADNRANISAFKAALAIVLRACAEAAAGNETVEWPSDAPADLIAATRTGSKKSRERARKALADGGWPAVRVFGGTGPRGAPG